MRENPDTLKQIIANNLRRHRAKAKLSQEALADLCDLHRTYIGSVERCERNVTISTLCTLSNALNVSVIDLLSTYEDSR